ncbi:hypothetical protein MASR2M18_13420 [Ignavibacteria bacterium]|nr:polyhydroxyalkanoic acid system family protein [Bacteroidota bacterium]MCZ2132287.1 polyhydroxyalkanoic acid system family protein [Bacteroidota bacterium]
MATIHKKFTTDKNAVEIKKYIDETFLDRKEVKALIDTAVWVGFTLHVTSKFGKGTLEARDNLAEVNIELSLFGSAAKKAIETTIEKNFKELGP